MRFACFYLLVVLWLLWRMIKPLQAQPLTKVIWGALIVALGAFPTVIQLGFGGLISPEVPRDVLLASQFCGMILVALLILTLVREAVVFITVLMGRRGEKAHECIAKDRRAALGLMVAGSGLAVAGVAEGIEVPDVTQHTFPVKRLPQAFEGFKIVQLSDIHASALLREPHIQALVERVNALEPDLILITGDMADGTVENRRKDVEPLKGLKARYGVLVCEGDHEHYSDYDHWVKMIPELNMELLRNAHKVIQIGEDQLVIGGVTDPMAKRFGRELPDVEKTFAGAPAYEVAPRILMAHQPRPAMIYEQLAPFDLQLSGHTHGGQAIGMDIAVALLNNDFVRGWYTLKHTHLFVHSGSGLWNGVPIRLGVPSEIALITSVNDDGKTPYPASTLALELQGQGAKKRSS